MKNPVSSESYLTAEEVAAWLRFNKYTLYRMARAGQIPADRVGRHWRFHKSDINVWLRRQESPLAPDASH